MSTREALGPLQYQEALASAARVLEAHAGALDDLHRDPPLDGTVAVEPGAGRDLAVTLAAAVAEAEGARDFAAVSEALAAGAAGACTGRAGRGTATLLAGIGEVLRNADRLDGTRLALALEAAAERLAPGETGGEPGGFGAVVTVCADAALAAADGDGGLAEVLLQATDAGLEELERGPESNPRLARRGVVDAAAAGFLLMLDTLTAVVTGEPLPAPPDEPARRRVIASAGPAVMFRVSCRLVAHDDPDGGGPAGVEATVSLEDDLVELARVVRLEPIGGGWVVELDTIEPGAVVEALVDHGRPREVRISLAAASSDGTGAPSRSSVAAGARRHDEALAAAGA